MTLNVNVKPVVVDTDIEWELQRRAYVQSSTSLNPEFAHFKQINAPFNEALDYKLSAHVEPRVAMHLPRGYHHLQVYSGKAWVTYHAKDHVLKAGDEMRFEQDSQEAVISSTGKETLTFEIIR
ncbi:MAG: hypothetical protein GC179_13780 [Anaerolineaceae bacterium]|nr:hypothetical protein [Anaerolineaceae bacterium]